MLLKISSLLKRKSDQQGFTLVELIVVMAILAVLAAIAVPKFTGVLDTSKRNASDSNLDAIAKAAEAYWGANNSTIPEDIDVLTPDYLKEVPANPASASDGYNISATTANGIILSPGKYGTATAADTTFKYTF